MWNPSSLSSLLSVAVTAPLFVDFHAFVIISPPPFAFTFKRPPLLLMMCRCCCTPMFFHFRLCAILPHCRYDLTCMDRLLQFIYSLPWLRFSISFYCVIHCPIAGVIGQGGGGVVYQGVWRGLTVAVKTVVSAPTANRHANCKPRTFNRTFPYLPLSHLSLAQQPHLTPVPFS